MAVSNDKTEYVTTYTPSLLDSVPRKNQRQTLGITDEALPFKGMDMWNAYEFSWLNKRGKPEVAVAQFQVPAKSPLMISGSLPQIATPSIRQRTS